jgi:hypothetical protein
MRQLSITLISILLMATPALADDGRYVVLKETSDGVYLVLDTETGGTKICVGKVSAENCIENSRGGSD